MSSLFKIISLRLRSLFKANAVENELDAEVQFHLDMLIQEKIDQGLDPFAAKQQARIDFGFPDQVKEQCRDSWGIRVLFDFVRDVRFGLRQLAKQKAYTFIAIATITLSIGASTAVFSLVNDILLSTLSIPHPEELHSIYWEGENTRISSLSTEYSKMVGRRYTADSFSHPMYQSFREHSTKQANIFGFWGLNNITLQTNGNAITRDGQIVTDNFFTGLGIHAYRGELFKEGDDAAGNPNIIITYNFWKNHFNSSPTTLGQPITIYGTPFTITGILPKTFPGIRQGEERSFYVSFSANSPFIAADITKGTHWFIHLMARLKPDTNPEQLKLPLDALFEEAVSDVVDNPKILVESSSGGLPFDRRAYKTPLMLILGVVGMVLLVACFNLAGLSLVRGSARQHELSIRAALGAGRGRLIRQSLTESLTLATIGGGLGILIAIWGAKAFSRMLAGNSGGLGYDFSIDLNVLGFSLILTLLTALLTGLLPALRAGKVDPLDGLKNRGIMSSSHLKLGKLLVSAQICISIILLVGASLYARSFINLHNIDSGFDHDNLFVFEINPGSGGYDASQRITYYKRIQEELTEIPGIKNATPMMFPLFGNSSSSTSFNLSDNYDRSQRERHIHLLAAGNTFFDTLDISIKRGRGFDKGDSEASANVVVVNETFVKKFISDDNPIGLIMELWGTDWTIIGVCQDVKYDNLKEPILPITYLEASQRIKQWSNAMLSATFVVRSELPLAAITTEIQEAVERVDPNIPVYNLTTQTQIRDSNIGKDNLLATLCGALALLALLLSCIGLYGLLAYEISRRSGEIAIRMAIGATPSDVSRPIFKESFMLALYGIIVALPVSYVISKYIKSQLWEVQPADTATLLIVITSLIAIVIIATWIPVRRATRMSPLNALRAE